MDIVSYSALIPLGHLWLWLRHSVALTIIQLGEGSYYEAPTSDLATALTLLAQSLSAPKKSSDWAKV